MSAERLLRLLEIPADEALPPDLEAWLRDGIQAAVFERLSLPEALDLNGRQGCADGIAQVRRCLRNAALRTLGERLEPGGTHYVQAAAVHDAWSGVRELDPEGRSLLDLACQLYGVPAQFRSLVRLFRQLRAEDGPEIRVSRQCAQAAGW